MPTCWSIKREAESPLSPPARSKPRHTVFFNPTGHSFFTFGGAKITWGFLARALCALVCGPVLGVVFGFSEDILSGLKKGDRVVTKGAIQVKLASASNAIPAHNHNH